MTRTAGTPENSVNPKSRDPSGAGETVPQGYGTHETHRAISDACRVYRYRDLEHNLQRFGWRRARKRVLRRGALSGQWINRGRGELRLRRGGLEVRLDDGGNRLVGWKELQGFVRVRSY